MSASKSSIPVPHATSPAGTILRQWRARRGWSQLDLANEARASQRLVSFIESGRGRASRGLLIALSEALGMPLRERNALLLAAGFAPIYADTPWDAAEMGTVKKALERMLRQHAPFPAIVMDRHWNVLMTNDEAPRFFAGLIDMAARQGQRDLLRLMFDPQGMRPHIENWEQVARGLFERMRREAVGGRLDGEAHKLIAELQSMSGFAPGFASEWERADAAPAGPVLPIGFIKDGQVRNYFSMVSTVGTPQTVAAQELRVECMFPADDATEAWHLAHFGGGRLPTS